MLTILHSSSLQEDVVYLNIYHFTNSQKGLFKRIIHDAVHLQALLYPVMLIGVHIGNHYVLAAVNFKLREIIVIDSMPGQNHAELFQAIVYFLSASFITQGLRLPLKWRYILESTAQVQADSSSCGVYVVYHAHCILRKKSFSRYSELLPNGRRRILNCLRTIDTLVKVPRVYPLRRIPPKDAELLAKVLQGLEMPNIVPEIGTGMTNIMKILREHDLNKCEFQDCDVTDSDIKTCTFCRITLHEVHVINTREPPACFLCNDCASNSVA